MIDEKHLDNIHLSPTPIGQRFVARFVLGPNYHLLQNVDIRLENLERIPSDETVIFAMNHTDRYNYWPFQYQLWRLNYPFTTVWAKGKYYRNKAVGKFLDACNVIPVPSMGYLVEEFYKQRFGRKIGREEYRIIKDWIDGKIDEAASLVKLKSETLSLFRQGFIEQLRDYHQMLMEKVAELSTKAVREWNLNLIIFPEGTRSLRLGVGRTGLAQIALYSGKKIIPVGCNNSDRIYTGHSPFAKSGIVTYRIGEPLSVEGALQEFLITEPFKLFSRESQQKFHSQFEGVTKLVMDRINELLDERHRRIESR
ncbi:MAG TPA: lysophospholipid acyltransferase family protein [Syntrophales bacterium]|nr:lysophospholipid acyltransferase family protein [Syntrophales bacterium]HOX95368.1 lysophospholipid acyltransferase family protein [Syntrophales bacterium]HPI56416.1 lysophospholipid acyltransferase family protein [Syntrophales bacterium]HPN24196.1 lysophospholipid acyltransferase family protein [Syntrophales bacterium]HQM28549.1 lysophospholipid acyltransferase family protein [Syntrophales bacterium]